MFPKYSMYKQPFSSDGRDCVTFFLTLRLTSFSQDYTALPFSELLQINHLTVSRNSCYIHNEHLAIQCLRIQFMKCNGELHCQQELYRQGISPLCSSKSKHIAYNNKYVLLFHERLQHSYDVPCIQHNVKSHRAPPPRPLA